MVQLTVYVVWLLLIPYPQLLPQKKCLLAQLVQLLIANFLHVIKKLAEELCFKLKTMLTLKNLHMVIYLLMMFALLLLLEILKLTRILNLQVIKLLLINLQEQQILVIVVQKLQNLIIHVQKYNLVVLYPTVLVQMMVVVQKNVV